MSIAELIERVQFVTDTEGNRQAVQINIESWEQIVDLLKGAEADVRWDQLFAQSPEVLEHLADEARIEREAERTRELDPDSL